VHPDFFADTCRSPFICSSWSLLSENGLVSELENNPENAIRTINSIISIHSVISTRGIPRVVIVAIGIAYLFVLMTQYHAFIQSINSIKT